MRKLLFILMLLFSIGSFAQEKLTYTEIVSVEKLDKVSLYAALRGWASITYVDSKEVIQMDDKDAGILLCSALFEFHTNRGLMYQAFDGIVKYTLKLQVRDGRFKAELSNLIHDNAPGKSQRYNLGLITTADIFKDKGLEKKYYNDIWGDVKEQSKEYFERLLRSMEDEISKAEPLIDNSDSW